MATNTKDRLVGPPEDLAWVAVGSGRTGADTAALIAGQESESAKGAAQACWSKERGRDA